MPTGLLVARLYGSNTNIMTNGITKKTPTIVEITALSDVVYFDFDVTGLFAGVELESDTKDLWNGGQLTVNTARLKFQPKTVPFSYPAQSVSTDAYFGINVINKRYKWIDIKDYKIRPDSMADTAALAVNVTEYSIEDNGNGKKSISFTLVGRG